jgi:hypothetical protein
MRSILPAGKQSAGLRGAVLRRADRGIKARYESLEYYFAKFRL